MRGVDRQLANGTLHQLLHLHTAPLHLGQRLVLVLIPLGVRSYEPHHIVDRVHGFHRSMCSVPVLLARDTVRVDRDFVSVFHLLCRPKAVFPHVSSDDPVDEF